MTNITNARVRALVDAVPEGQDVLDVGCVQHHHRAERDPNWLHQHLVARSESVVGIDILDWAVEELQARGYEVQQADAETFDLEREFDVVVAGELIEHLSRPGQFLDRAREHLHDDGELLLTTPNPWALVHLRRALAGVDGWNAEHTCWFDAQTLRQLLARHGYTDIEIGYVRASDPGLTQLAHRVGWHRLGATSLLARARPANGANGASRAPNAGHDPRGQTPTDAPADAGLEATDD